MHLMLVMRRMKIRRVLGAGDEEDEDSVCTWYQLSCVCVP